MKPFIVTTISLAVFAISGCNKKNNNTETDPAKMLVGTWELRKSFSGMMPDRTYPLINKSSLVITETTVTEDFNGYRTMGLNYRLVSDSAIDVNNCQKLPPPAIANKMVFGSDPEANGWYFALSGNTLTITSGCIPLDGGWSIYKKVK